MLRDKCTTHFGHLTGIKEIKCHFPTSTQVAVLITYLPEEQHEFSSLVWCMIKLCYNCRLTLEIQGGFPGKSEAGPSSSQPAASQNLARCGGLLLSALGTSLLCLCLVLGAGCYHSEF